MRDLIKLFAAGAFIVALGIAFANVVKADEDIGTGLFDKMKVANPIVQCNTFAIAYANGMYEYGEGLDDPWKVEIPEAIVDADGQKLFVELIVAGHHTARGYLEGSEMERSLALEIAPDFYRKLEKVCKVTNGDLDVAIGSLTNLGPYTIEFIKRLQEHKLGRRL